MTREENDSVTILYHVLPDHRGIFRILELQPGKLHFDIVDGLGCGLGLELEDVKIMYAALTTYLAGK